MVELTQAELERRQVSDFITYLEKDELYRIDDLIEQHGKGLTLYVETDWYYDDCSVTIRLSVDRLETDEEYEARIERTKVQKAKNALAAEKRRKAAQDRKKAKEAVERELYEKLRKKYEKE